MRRLSYILILILLAHTHQITAQHGHELDTQGRFDFLKEHQNNGDYILDKTEDVVGDSMIVRVHFLTEANFYNAQFDSHANFLLAQFDSHVDFFEAQFHSKVDFFEAQFDSIADFYGTQYHSRADFVRSRFYSEVDFVWSEFHSLADFSWSQFHSEVDFTYAEFYSVADFSQLEFYSLAYFSNTQFESLADFSYTQFHSSSDFSSARFASLADFSNTQFKEGVNFSLINLPDTLDFQKLRIATEIDLTNAERSFSQKSQGRYCLIDLRDAPIEKFKLRYDEFRVFWPDSINRDEYERLTNVYEGLLKNFKDRGYLTSFATLDQEYQAFKDLQNPDASEIKKLLNKVNFYWNNYGYNKERIWLWTLVFLALATLFNWLAFPHLVKDVYSVPMIEKALFKGKSWKQKQFAGIPLFWNTIHLNFKHLRLAFFYTCLIFFGLKISTERINFEKYGGVTLIFTEYLLGLICLGYLANFIISSGLIGK